MPAPATVDEFVDLIRKSAVLDEARLSGYVEKLKSDPTTPKDLSAIAGLFVRDGLLTFFQAEQFLQGKWKRFTIGKYKVLERLGSGGMGQVFLCEHKLMRRRVAVKVLPTQKAADPSSLERFYREARAVAALDHPNIVRAYDIDQDDNLHFLVMEYVDGASLQEMIRKTGPMDPVRACHYMYWSAVGLQHAHQQGLIHRDIKPGNILVDRTGVVKILDLGLARFFLDEDDLLTKKYDESVLGTADYLAPEQAVDSHTVDGRADIYSLGATFYFLLTGQPPFAEGTVAQKLLWHQSKNPKSVRDVRAEVPEAVARIVTKMMAKKPEDRFQTPGELVESLLPFTQTPIPPPPEVEMPQLSVAAQGTSTGPPSVTAAPPRTMTSAPRTPLPAPAKKATMTVNKPAAPGTKALPPRRGSNGVPVSEADTQRKNTPAPVVEPISDSGPDAPIWEAISADTANNQRSDTDRKRRDASSRRIKPDPKSGKKDGSKSGNLDRKTRFPIPLVLTIVGGLLLLGAGIFVAYWVWIRDPGKNKSTEPRRLSVLKTAGPNQFSSVKKAIEVAREGDTILIEDQDIEETVAISRIKNLTIMPGDGIKRVSWRAPVRPDSAVLALANMEGCRIVGITFEANSKVDHAVRLGGHCPGLVLENVDMVNAKVAPLLLHDCTGDKTRPVTIKNCRATGTNVGAGIVFRSDPSTKPGFPAPGSQSVVIQNCLVDGPTSGPAILFEGSAAADIRNCRIWKGATGVHFHKASDRLPSELMQWQVNLIGNTFHGQGSACISIDDVAQLKNRQWNRITIGQDYFAGSPMAIKIDGDAAGTDFLAIDPKSNVRKPPTQPGQAMNFSLPPMIESPAEVDVSLDSSNPARFLFFDKTVLLSKWPGAPTFGAQPE
jgi:eukaryotic-like serine/threonine-protein kinase